MSVKTVMDKILDMKMKQRKGECVRKLVHWVIEKQLRVCFFIAKP